MAKKKKGGAPKGNKYAVGNPGGGRPSRYKPEYADMAYRIALLGATDVDLADVFGVSEVTINKWKIAHKDFCLALKKGKTLADSNVADRLYQRAMGFEHNEEELKVVSIGNGGGSSVERHQVRKIYPPDTAAAIFWLKNRQKKLWRDKVEHGLTDEDGKDVITMFQLPDNGRNANHTPSAGLSDAGA